jgi:hypothetical protein
LKKRPRPKVEQNSFFFKFYDLFDCLLEFFLASFSRTAFAIVTPRLETIDPDQITATKIKEIKQTLLKSAKAAANLLARLQVLEPVAGHVRHSKNLEIAKTTERIIRISPRMDSI